MMRNFKANKMSFRLALLMSLIAAPCGAASAESSFGDVEPGSWYEPAIRWAVERHIVSGYEDGTFRPDRRVTEAEFVTMLVRTSGASIRDTRPGEPWYEPYYVKAADYPLPVSLLAEERTGFVNRGRVAAIIAAYVGQRLEPEEAIRLLLKAGISQGKTAPTVEGYAALDLLTRSEAVAFVQNVVAYTETLKHFTPLPVPEVTTPPEEPAAGAATGGSRSRRSGGDRDTPPVQTRPESPSVPSAQQQAVLAKNLQEDVAVLGVTMEPTSKGVKIAHPSQPGSGVILTKTADAAGELQMLDAENETILRAAYALLKSVGVSMAEEEFTGMVGKVNKTGTNTSLKIGGQIVTASRSVPAGTVIVRYVLID